MKSQSFENREIADSDQTEIKLGKGLGMFSLGLGLAELLAPRMISRLIGVDPDGRAPTILRLFGLREIAAAVPFFAKPPTVIGPWMRVAGDAIDIAALALAMRHSTSKPRTINALAMVAGATAIDVFAGVRQARRKLAEPVKTAVTIARPANEIYAFWRDVSNIPQFMSWVQSVRDLGDNKSHWIVRTPAGVNIEYDAEITEDVPGRRIAWRSLPGTVVPNRGMVTFVDAPGGRGTEVIVEMQVAAPLGKTIASQEAMGDLRRLKQVLEIGEVVVSDATIHRGPHPAQPPALDEGVVR